MIFVSGINMSSALLILILDRTNMIGILKSMGATNWSIRKIFLYLSGYLITIGLFWGNLIGIGLAYLQKSYGIIKLPKETYYIPAVPIDISITKTVAGLSVSVIILLWLVFSVASASKRNKGKAPTGVQNLLEPLIIFIRDEVAKPIIGDKKFEKFMPFLLTVFFFILINNFMGLIPIPPFGANVTGNIAITLVLALFTFGITTINGNKHYWKEIYNPDVPWWLKFPIPLMPIVELLGLITKPFVLMVRLFANMVAGHMIVSVFVSLIFIFASLFGTGVGFAASPVSVAFSVFILLLDVLVSFIQAYVFTLLSALYFGMATADHH